MIPLFLCNSASNFQRKSQKIENNDNQIFYFIFCIFLKNRRVELSFQCRNEFYMPKYPNNHIFMGFGEKRGFSTNFCPYYSMAMWRLWAQKLINTISAEFGVFPSKNHDSDILFYFLLKVEFQCRNEFYMPKYPNNHIFMGFGEKRGFSTNFCPYYSMAMWRLWAQKLINTISAEFGVFPSKNHDSIVFMQFCQ